MKRAQSSASAELRRLTLTQATQLLQQKKLSLVELYQAIDSTVAASNEQLNIYLTLHPDDAPPEGLPVAVKDNICTAGTQTTASSLVLDRFVPPFDATVVQKLRAADLAVYGKTNPYLGLNIMAPMWHEETIIKIGDAYKQATNWNSWRQHDQ